MFFASIVCLFNTLIPIFLFKTNEGFLSSRFFLFVYFACLSVVSVLVDII